MRVAHQDDHITHAVISPKKSMEFGISSSAGFFQILSSALYKNPMLAMVRETICNAWDAHIDSGLDNIHHGITITLTDSHLIIRDYGKGIHEDQIQPIYGIYGASTKTSDGRQTGGFGLGCKSPFAYSDHFEVTSSHDGRRTIYNMSKSSGKLDGKPSITPIATFPTTESGITVKIPLASHADTDKLGQMIREVVFNGDIIATLNDKPLPRLGLDASDCGMLLISHDDRSRWSRQREPHEHLLKNQIWVRYGNVIYPIEWDESYGDLFDRVNHQLVKYYNCSLILQAEPDSLSITPSREALTMSEISSNTIRDLLVKFIGQVTENQELMVRHHEMVKELVDNEAISDEKSLIQKLPVTTNWRVPGVPYVVPHEILKTKEEFSAMEVFLRYSGRHGRIKSRTWLKFITRFLFLLQKNNSEDLDLGRLQSWLRHARKNVSRLREPTMGHYVSAENRAATKWWQTVVLRPLLNKLTTAIPDITQAQISYYSENVLREDYRSPRLELVRCVRTVSHTQNMAHLLKPTVIISHSTSTAPNRATYTWKNANVSRGTLQFDTFFHIQVGRKTGEAESVLQALQGIPGIEVIDLCARLPVEQEEYDRRQEAIAQARADKAAGRTPTVVVKKARPGLVCLTEIIDDGAGQIDTRLLQNNLDPVRLTTPKFVTKVSLSKDTRNCSHDMNRISLYAAAKLYGAETAFTNIEKAYESYMEKGAVNLRDHVFKELVKDMTTSPTLLEYHSISLTKVTEYLVDKCDWRTRGQLSAFYNLLTRPELCHLIPGYAQLSVEDEYRRLIWDNMDMPYDERKIELAARETISNIPLKPELVTFLDQLIENKFLGLFATGNMEALLSNSEDDPTTLAKATTLITTILS